jgi:hypothetical protein
MFPSSLPGSTRIILEAEKRHCQVGCSALRLAALDEESECWTCGCGPLGVFEQHGCDQVTVEDGVAPVIDGDHLRQQLSAEAVRLAGDRVDT